MGGDLIASALLLLGIGFLLAFVFTIWLLSRFLRGIWLWATIAALCVAICYLFYVEILKPSAELRAVLDFRGKVTKDCDLALQASPEEVQATSLTDEVAGLADDQLVQLLAERGLDFVEVNLHGPNDIGSAWTVFLSHIPGGFKFELQHLAAPVRCRDDQKIPAVAC